MALGSSWRPTKAQVRDQGRTAPESLKLSPATDQGDRDLAGSFLAEVFTMFTTDLCKDKYRKAAEGDFRYDALEPRISFQKSWQRGLLLGKVSPTAVATAGRCR